MSLRPVDEVIAELLDRVPVTEQSETRRLDDALGCCLAADIVSGIDVPPGDNSAMDGYALAVQDANLDNPLQVSARIPAGHPGDPLLPGTVARIFTGGHVPAGADAVVMQENTEAGGENSIRLLKLPSAGENIRTKGQDVYEGQVILERGELLTPQALSLAASVGVAELTVQKPLRIAVMSTGDELVEPGDTVAPGQIYNSNRYGVSALLRQMGFQVLDLGIIADEAGVTREVLQQAAAEADCIITSGGVSVGEEDHVKAAVEELGRIDLWKLAIKPGKPLAYGVVNGTPFFGLPGNPVSTFVTLWIVARPCLLAMQGARNVQSRVVSGIADFSYKGGGRREYIRVRTQERDGELRVEKFPNQGSGIMTSVAWADALAEIEIGQSVSAGDLLKLYPLPGSSAAL